MSIHQQHRQRVKEKFHKYGLQGMAPHEILEFLLFFSVPQKDTNPLAHRLINRFGSLQGVLDAPFEYLLEVDGVGEHTATLLKLMVPLLREYQKEPLNKINLNCSERLGAFLTRRYFGYKTEVVSLLCMDSNFNVLSYDEVCQGDVAGADFSIRKVLELVIRNTAACVVLAHNHPGGTAVPSNLDIKATEDLALALQAVGVRLLDHVIVVPGDYVSMRESASFAHLFR